MRLTNTAGRIDTAKLRERRAALHEAGTLPTYRPTVGIDEPGGAGSFAPCYVNVNARQSS